MTTTWDTGFSVSTITFSGGNLTGAINSTASASALRSTTSKSTGKWYAEFTLNTISNNGYDSMNVGMGDGALSNNGDLGHVGTKAFCVQYDGVIATSSSGIGTGLPSSPVNGSVIGMAVDLTGSLVWFRFSPSGNWNNNASYSPGGTGGANISSVTANAPLFLAGYFDAVVGFSMTLNTGATAFSGSLPSGFSAWDGGSSFDASKGMFQLVGM